MQTIKTAAILVLLMTVIYGAYVSLTTPPEPLPADVEDMLVMSDEAGLSIESSLPPSLAELGISTGTTEALTSNPGIGDSPIGIATTLGQPEVTPLDASTTNAESARGFAAISPAPSTGVPVDFVSATLPANPASTSPLPSVPTSPQIAPEKSIADEGYQTTFTDSPSVSTSAGPASGYPSTNQQFQMPDPASLDPTHPLGTPRDAAGRENPRSHRDPGNAKNQGHKVFNNTPTSSVSQVAAIDQTKPNLGLVNAIRAADRQYQADQRREALSTLSIFYSVPGLTTVQRTELLSRLDPLAAEVIYSNGHLLERPYRVARNETLMEIAERYEVPWQLLANINQVSDPVTIVPGTELKVVRGPFRAEVHLSKQELTLFLGDLYAGRFPIGIGSDPAPKTGTYTVQDKQTSRTFYDASGAPVAPESPRNPYGNAWIDLGGQFCIHGSPSTTEPSDQGCISLAADFADDLYGILSRGSTVMVRE